MSNQKPIPPKGSASVYERQLAGLFRRNGWQVKVHPSLGNQQADLIVAQNGFHYIVELKAASEGRRDRLVPLLAQAVLQAQALAKASPEPAFPLAVIAAPVISPSVVVHLQRFLAENAPQAAIGLLDSNGLQFFAGQGLEKLNAPRSSRVRRQQHRLPESAPLFSDLNQWMLKVLLAQLIPEGLLHAPRAQYHNASQLAEGAGVSVMSAFRLVRQLRHEGFLDHNDGILRLVRRDELMRRWQAVYLRALPELPLRWLVPAKGNERRLSESLHDYMAHPDKSRDVEPRTCLGLFAAAEQLGFGFVHGIAPSFYLENLDRKALARLGLSPEGAERVSDVSVRVPAFRESVFRGAVLRKGVPVADVLQVWLDVAAHPARGAAQAEEIRRRALAPIFKDKVP